MKKAAIIFPTLYVAAKFITEEMPKVFYLKGHVLPIFTSARSFDGIYSRTIPQNSIKTRVEPILTC